MGIGQTRVGTFIPDKKKIHFMECKSIEADIWNKITLIILCQDNFKRESGKRLEKTLPKTKIHSAPHSDRAKLP